MELYIQVKDGQPFEHPILADNFRHAFPDVDTNNLPSEFARFIRIAPPLVSVYEICETTYCWKEGVITDVHNVRQMTDEEKLEKQLGVKAQWDEHGYASWIFDESLCRFVPPVPAPLGKTPYRWDEETLSWVELRL